MLPGLLPALRIRGEGAPEEGLDCSTATLLPFWLYKMKVKKPNLRTAVWLSFRKGGWWRWHRKGSHGTQSSIQATPRNPALGSFWLLYRWGPPDQQSAGNPQKCGPTGLLLREQICVNKCWLASKHQACLSSCPVAWDTPASCPWGSTSSPAINKH